jgi:hypothetical protein
MGHAAIARKRDSCDVSIGEFVLREFRLHAAETADDAARIVAEFSDGLEPAVPLLRSIDDHRDVAIVGALHAGERLDEQAQRAALGPLVASWQPAKRYGPRISESSDDPPSTYRLAVTESGINDAADQPAIAMRTTTVPDDAPTTHVGLMWVGVPIGSYAGLMVLLGSYDDQPGERPDPREWPLALSRQFHIRIYETLSTLVPLTHETAMPEQGQA